MTAKVLQLRRRRQLAPPADPHRACLQTEDELRREVSRLTAMVRRLLAERSLERAR